MTLDSWFAAHDMALEEIEGVPDTRRGRILGRNAAWDVFVTGSDDDVVQFWSMWEPRFDPDRLVDMVMLANRANGLMRVATLIVDELRMTVGLRTSIDVAGQGISDALLARLVGRNVDLFDQLVLLLSRVRDGEDGSTIEVVLTGC